MQKSAYFGVGERDLRSCLVFLCNYHPYVKYHTYHDFVTSITGTHANNFPSATLLGTCLTEELAGPLHFLLASN